MHIVAKRPGQRRDPGYAGVEVAAGFDGVKVKRGERVFDGLPGEMLQERSRDGCPTLVSAGAGTIVITNLRVAFNRAKRREWSFDQLRSKQHQGDDTTLMTVSNRRAVSGVRYPAGAERTRVLIDLAIADAAGDRRSIIQAQRARLSAHDRARPVAPQPPVPPAEHQGLQDSPGAVRPPVTAGSGTP